MDGHSSASETPQSIGMLLLPGFNAMAAHAFLDPFRAANYLRARNVFEWNFLSPDGGEITASNGAVFADTQSLRSQEQGYDFVMVNASWTPEQFQEQPLQSWLRAASRKGSMLGGIDTGAFVLGYAGLLDSHSAVVHYEHRAAFEELFPTVLSEESLYVIDRRRLSCCGGAASIDLALEIIQMQNGIELANASARYIFHERLRQGSESQVPRHLEPVGYQMPQIVREAILLMERNVEEPLTLPELAQLLSMSVRQVQRLFKRYVGSTPLRYYLNIRLDRARGLVTQTELPIMDIAALTGFPRAEQLTRAYFGRFDITPIKDRIAGRIPFQFRNFTDHAGYHSID
ncbi:MAG: GlxA family transcriptional regulator [Pseudomonadota bacterium]